MIDLRPLHIVPGHGWRLHKELWVTGRGGFSLAGDLWEGIGRSARIDLFADGKDILGIKAGDSMFSRALTHAKGGQSPSFRCAELFEFFPELKAQNGYAAEVREIDGVPTILVFITKAGWAKGHPRGEEENNDTE